jgi:ABC-type multidrug transport system fused ATPase/permease subunit
MMEGTSYREALRSQITEALGKVFYTFTSHLKQMHFLARRGKLYRILQIALSAISTAGFIGILFTDEKWIALIGAVIAAALFIVNLMLKDFKYPEEASRHRAASDELWLIRERNVSLLTDMDTLDTSKIIAIRDELRDQTYEVNKAYPKTSNRSYKEAQKALKDEEEQYFHPSEAEKFLPAYLRQSAPTSSQLPVTVATIGGGIRSAPAISDS